MCQMMVLYVFWSLWKTVHQCRSAGRPSARRLSADFIDDGQTVSNNATREKRADFIDDGQTVKSI